MHRDLARPRSRVQQPSDGAEEALLLLLVRALRKLRSHEQRKTPRLLFPHHHLIVLSRQPLRLLAQKSSKSRSQLPSAHLQQTPMRRSFHFHRTRPCHRHLFNYATNTTLPRVLANLFRTSRPKTFALRLHLRPATTRLELQPVSMLDLSVSRRWRSRTLSYRLLSWLCSRLTVLSMLVHLLKDLDSRTQQNPRSLDLWRGRRGSREEARLLEGTLPVRAMGVRVWTCT